MCQLNECLSCAGSCQSSWKNTQKALCGCSIWNTSPLMITASVDSGNYRRAGLIWAHTWSSGLSGPARWASTLSPPPVPSPHPLTPPPHLGLPLPRPLPPPHSAADSVSEFVFWWCRRSPNLSFPIQTFLKIMKQQSKVLLCNWVNITLFCTDSSRKSSKQILGVIWEICVRTRTQLWGECC